MMGKTTGHTRKLQGEQQAQGRSWAGSTEQGCEGKTGVCQLEKDIADTKTRSQGLVALSSGSPGKGLREKKEASP